ncbi:MAG: beta-hexosaminidase [Paenibacillus sp.]|nr:beta-hexosaminidase [Paenibacillus sp.]
MSVNIIPSPKHHIDQGKLNLPLNRPVTVYVPHDGSALVRQAAEAVIEYMKSQGYSHTTLQQGGQQENNGADSYSLRFIIDGSGGEAYELQAHAKETVFTGAPHGLFHAAQTWIQLLSPSMDGRTLDLQLAIIKDEPDIANRGMFVECFNGSDLMNLQDWQHMIDEMVSLKLNTLSLGINGAWPRRYDQPDSPLDFLFVPLIDDPDRIGAKQMTYYDPAAQEETTIHYNTPFYEQDLLAPIMQYASDRGIRVIPLFNGPGHTTVLSQLYPQISAKDADGQPTGFGYSLTHPETLPMLKRIYTRLVERYMKPHGQTWVHIGCDEVHPYHYMNESMSDKAISPWCSEDLKHFTKKELFFKYISEIGSHLVELGMEKIIIWHDGVHGMFGFDESFEAMLEESGLAGKLAIHWWRYHEPQLDVKFIKGAENWIAPATGYFPNIVYQDYLDNIDIMVEEGSQKQAQAIVSYTLYSPLHHRNTAFLAEKSWDTNARVVDFEQAYARWISEDGTSSAELEDGFRRMRQVYGHYGHSYFLIETGIYFGNYYPRKAYPARILNTLANSEFGVETMLRLLALDLKRAQKYFAEAAPRADRKHLIHYNVMECERTSGVLNSLLHYSAAIRSYEQVRVHHPSRTELLADVYSRMEQALQTLQETLERINETQIHYYIPSSMREFTPLLRSMKEMLVFLKPWSTALETSDSGGKSADLPSAIPSLPIKGIRLEVYPNPRMADMDEG